MAVDRYIVVGLWVRTDVILSESRSLTRSGLWDSNSKSTQDVVSFVELRSLVIGYVGAHSEVGPDLILRVIKM